MKLRLVEVHRAKAALGKIMTPALPVRLAFKLARLAKEINSIYDDIEQQRIGLVHKYGVQDENGNWSVPRDKQDEFGNEFGAFLEEESVDLKNVESLSLDVLEPHITLSAMDAVALMPFISEG